MTGQRSTVNGQPEILERIYLDTPTTKILVVDDEPHIETLISKLFRKEVRSGQYQFVFAANGKQALDQLDQDKDIRIVITDIRMPEMDGLALLAEVSNRYPLLKCVVVSAYGDMPNIRTAMNRGAFDFLNKPIDLDDLRTTLDKTIAEVEKAQQFQQTRKANVALTAESEKLKVLDELKNRFFANISHEFRTPLTLILGPLDDLQQQANDDKTRRTIPLIARNARRLLRLINQMLDLSKLESGSMALSATESDFIAFLKGIVFSFSSLAEQKEIALQFTSDLDSLTLYFDRDKMEKIFYNLLSNSMKFTQEWGEISISAATGDAITIDQQPAVEIRVKDSGIGIPADQLAHVFDRFYQAANNPSGSIGTGIGLALVKELCELQSGTISVESFPGNGTEFTLRFLLGKTHLHDQEIQADTSTNDKSTLDEALQELRDDLQLDDGHSRETSPAIFADDNSQALLLIVEDHPDVRHYISEQLAGSYQIATATNGQEGLASAQAMIPDLIISDVMMPEMNGFEFCQSIKADERTSHIPVILLTARAGDESKLTGLETGADDYLTKPFNSQELKVRVRNLIDQRQRLRIKRADTSQEAVSNDELRPIDRQFLERIEAAIESHISDEAFSVEQLGREVNMDRTQVHRKLRALINRSAGEHIQFIRMQHAAALLKGSADAISEIAYQVGFADPSYFTKCFRKQFGVSPKEFRA